MFRNNSWNNTLYSQKKKMVMTQHAFVVIWGNVIRQKVQGLNLST